MNLSEMIAEINKDIDDDFDLATLVGWINRALDLASNVVTHEKRATLLLEDGVSDYDMPSDLLELKHVIGSNGEYFQLDLTDQCSIGFKWWGNTVGFQNITETAIDLYYYGYLPHLVEPDDIPALPIQFHDLPVLYAVARAKYQDEQGDLYGSALSEFNERLRELTTFITRSQKPERVQDVYGGF